MKLPAPARPRLGLRRRDLIKGLGGAALALPALELFERELRAQTAPRRSKFVVFLYTPDGVDQRVFWPSGTETAFTLSSILAPFEPFKDRMLILGPQMDGATPHAGTGLAYNISPLQHQAPVTLAARAGTGCLKGGVSCTMGDFGLPYGDQSVAVNRVDGPSIDQVIAKAVQGDSLFSSLSFGLHPVGGDTPSDVHFADDGTSLRRMDSAEEAWARVFGGVVAGGAAEVPAALRKHAAVTDYLHARFGALRGAVGAADRQTLDRHLTSLRAYEDRKARLLAARAAPAPQCALPARLTVPADETSVRTGADTEKLSPFFMDMIATAFACDLTKVASLSFGYPGGGGEGGLRMPWLGFTDPLHGVSHHGGNPALLDKYRRMQTWIAGQVAGLMHRLAAVPLGGGSLLDQTTIYWFNRHGDGDAHSNYALPNLILGGTGGFFKTGHWLQLPATSPTKVLISIAHAMGVPLTSFGKDAFADTAPLSSIHA